MLNEDGWRSVKLPSSAGWHRVYGFVRPDATDADVAALVRADRTERGTEIDEHARRVVEHKREYSRVAGWQKYHPGEKYPEGGAYAKIALIPKIKSLLGPGTRFVTPTSFSPLIDSAARRSYISLLMRKWGWTKVKLPPTRPDTVFEAGWLCPGFMDHDADALIEADRAERGAEIDAEAERREQRRAFTIRVGREKIRLRKVAAEPVEAPPPPLPKPPKAAARIGRITQSVGDRRFITRGLLNRVLPDGLDRQYFISNWERIAGWRDAMISGHETHAPAGVPLVMLAPNATEADLEAAFLQDIAERGTGNWLWYLPRLCRAWAKNSCADRFHGTEFRTP